VTTVQGPRGTYRPCPVCRAPIVDPFPEAWEIEMVKEGPPQGPVKTFITPHRDDCDAPYADPQPGLALRLPGRTVASLRFDLPPPVSAVDPLGLRLADRQHLAQDPTVPVDWTGWTDLGATSEGFTWAHAVDDVDAGQAVSFAGPGHLFVKPFVRHDLDAVLGTGGVVHDDGGVPVLDAIMDAAGVHEDEP
jgi:hypothetical protein